jgi:histidinol-phosphate/aromatic aminotransferase/cobyric acid decarboxylase-like protein
MNKEYSQEVILSDQELVRIFESRREGERKEYGENITFGPGYGRCVRDYSQSIRSNDPGLLLEALSRHLSLESSKIVPVMAGSCNSGAYLHDVSKGTRIVPISSDLDLVVFDDAEEAKVFRTNGEMILPLSSTREVIESLNSGELPEQHRPENFDKEGVRERDTVKQLILEKFGLPESASIHLGSEAALQAVFKLIGKNKEGSLILFPVPNYFDAMLFAKQNGCSILPVEELESENLSALVSKSQVDALYISNPNNPTGKRINLDEMCKLIEVLPLDVKIIIDEVNISLETETQFMSTPWRELFERFPDRKIVIVDSFSKSHGLVGDRIGVALASDDEDQKQLLDLQPPRLATGTKERLQKTFLDQIEPATVETIRSFHKKLKGISERFGDKITVSSFDSNFCVVYFPDENLRDKFFEEIDNIDPSSIQAKQIIGKPQIGAGELSATDLNLDGSLNLDLVGKSGILGLPKNAVRLSSLSHPTILDALEKALT